MPINNFNAIETENYRLSPTLLEVKKDYLNHHSGGEIFATNNVSAKIVETLPPDMVMLNGKRHACMRFRLSAVKFTDTEIAQIEADKKKKAEEQAKKDAVVVKDAAAAAPPPGPVTAAPVSKIVMSADEKAELKDVVGPPKGRLPGELPKA